MSDDVRINRADRSQPRFEVVDLESQLGEDHRARTVWEFVSGLDLSEFYDRIKARVGTAGWRREDVVWLKLQGGYAVRIERKWENRDEGGELGHQRRADAPRSAGDQHGRAAHPVREVRLRQTEPALLDAEKPRVLPSRIRFRGDPLHPASPRSRSPQASRAGEPTPASYVGISLKGG